jgi:hypothetical protein
MIALLPITEFSQAFQRRNIADLSAAKVTRQLGSSKRVKHRGSISTASGGHARRRQIALYRLAARRLPSADVRVILLRHVTTSADVRWPT